MPDNQDPRYRQLEREFKAELEGSKSLFSEKNFGRSTENVKASDKVGQEYQSRVALLNQIIGLEEAAKRGGDVGEALSFLSVAAEQKKQEAAQRRAQLTQEGNKLAADALRQLYAFLQDPGSRMRPGGLSPAQEQMGVRMDNPPERGEVPYTSKNQNTLTQPRFFKQAVTPKRKAFKIT